MSDYNSFMIYELTLDKKNSNNVGSGCLSGCATIIITVLILIVFAIFLALN